mmetsp:Transcript_16985/g.39193  ORF Transcript_16985/g.39193 Transcript_16985/m.39193 type:complete len:223 (+) Transcript_16985:295-963(+)
MMGYGLADVLVRRLVRAGVSFVREPFLFGLAGGAFVLVFVLDAHGHHVLGGFSFLVLRHDLLVAFPVLLGEDLVVGALLSVQCLPSPGNLPGEVHEADLSVDLTVGSLRPRREERSVHHLRLVCLAALLLFLSIGAFALGVLLLPLVFGVLFFALGLDGVLVFDLVPLFGAGRSLGLVFVVGRILVFLLLLIGTGVALRLAGFLLVSILILLLLRLLLVDLL